MDGLAVLVKEEFQLDPFSPSLFVFCSRKRDKLKILHWITTGSGSITGALSGEPFSGQKNRTPPRPNSTPLEINRRQLRWLLDGLSLGGQQAHPEVTSRRTV
ncbi:IS66 family insertion sequence element accessory protein TnpB [Thermicanus aegyptius]|uniref:IS66 family insertion sequence element accessory protein TnpB n=1 Tax=Thermicanus aegyptius TaxID=94009 RepID=UPI0012EC3177